MADDLTTRVHRRGARGGQPAPRPDLMSLPRRDMARDASVFADPHTFDLHREYDARGRYLWYGAGPHFCIGFPLAQREMQLVVGALAGLPRRLVIVRRRAATRVLLPAYALLELRMEQ